MNIVNTLTYLGIIVVLVLFMWGIFYSALYGSAHSTTPNTPKGLAVTSAEVASYHAVALQTGIAQALTREHKVMLGEYSTNLTLPPLAIFPEWDSDSAQCARVFLFMENVIRSYSKADSEQSQKQKLSYAQNFIDRILPWFDTNKTIDEIPFGNLHSPFTILLPRLLVSYLIMIAKEGGSVKQAEVLLLLKRLVPSPNQVLGVTNSDFMCVYSTVAYLVCRLVEQPDTFNEARKRTNIANAWDFMNPTITNNKNLIVNRWYQDMTYCIDKLEFSYTPIVTLVGFYSTLWVGLGLPFSGAAIFRQALSKILHPDMDVIPKFAFSGYCDPDIDFRFYNSASEYGLQVYPSVGVGIYKGPNYYFAIKLVKPNQTLISIANNVSRYDALSTLFSRKIYFQENDLDITADCKSSLDAVNLIFDSSRKDTLISSIPKKVIGPADSAGVIGIIDYTLIWAQKYYVPELVNAEVFEVGIMAKFGIHQYYQIENKGSTVLDFVTPTDTRGHYMYNTILTDSKAKGPISIPAGEKATFFAYQKLSPNVNPKLSASKNNSNEFVFKTQHQKYTITFSANEQRIYIKPKDTKKPAMIITDLPDTNTSITYQGIVYTRNPTNLTFYAPGPST